MSKREDFIQIFNEFIHREGSSDLLHFLMSEQSDFFTAPASTRFHLCYEGGLVEHSLNVYNALRNYVRRPEIEQLIGTISDESIAICALLHDLCKMNVYKPSTRNKKDSTGKWVSVPTYEYRDELPYGHGEKSVYIISGFMKLKRDEAFAIRYHMGFSNTEDKMNVGQAFSKFPLAFCLSTADMEATFLMEKDNQDLE